MADLETFRSETRAWLEANCPEEMRQPVRDEEDVYWGGRNAKFKSDAQKAWFEACLAKGYTVPAWPKEYGGAGLEPAEAKILREEMARINARPPLSSFGIWMLGPALLHFGTEGQKAHYLNEIARGEIRWCQGYSEPGSGSDLVSMQTFGEDKGDHWVVNGQKIWTSYADEADWIFCLVRTDKANKYQGITFMLFDMASEGCHHQADPADQRQQPVLRNLLRRCEGAQVGEARLCRRNQSRLGRGQISARPRTRDDLRRWRRRPDQRHRRGHAAPCPGELDPMLRAELAMFDIDALAYSAMGEKFLDEIKVGKAHPAQPNMMKYVGTELNKRRHELMMAAGGSPQPRMGQRGNRAAASRRAAGCGPRPTRSRAAPAK